MNGLRDLSSVAEVPSAARALLKRILRSLGFPPDRIRRRSLPPLVDEPLEAWSRVCGGLEVSFSCELKDCVSFNGFSLARGGWHPFVCALREYQQTRQKEYSGSFLERFYRTWRPTNALEALIGAGGPKDLSVYPSYLMHSPWMTTDPDERLTVIADVVRWENEHIGKAPLSVSHGYGLHGPVSHEKGSIELKRLLDVYDSIRAYGYERTHGPIVVQLLERSGELRYLVVHGHHRTAAAAALGHETIPARPELLVQRTAVRSWPHVVSGLWSPMHALQYFDHLFDFNSSAWARERGLLSAFPV